MFYEFPIPSNKNESSAIVVLTPPESKRLIAKAVAILPEVQRALKEGRIIIGNGTTNAYVAEEILGISIPKINYAAGIITKGKLSTIPKAERWEPIVLINGKQAKTTVKEALQEFTADDVVLKGANAVDTQGDVGILVANKMGGTIGQALPICAARGSHLIVPVGLEKLIPSVADASTKCGIHRFTRMSGHPVGYMPLINSKVVTEIQALEMLCGVMATQVAAGGMVTSQGSVVLVLEGERERVDYSFELIQSIKQGEVHPNN